jgi:hypothetical protein
MEFDLAYEPMAVVNGGAVKEMVHLSNLRNQRDWNISLLCFTVLR